MTPPSIVDGTRERNFLRAWMLAAAGVVALASAVTVRASATDAVSVAVDFIAAVAIVYLTYRLLQVNHEVAKVSADMALATKAMASLAQAEQDRRKAHFTVEPNWIKVDMDDFRSAPAAQRTIHFAVTNEGWHDSAIKEAYTFFEGPKGEYRQRAFNVKRNVERSGGGLDDVMVRAGDRVWFTAHLGIPDNHRGSLSLHVSPALGTSTPGTLRILDASEAVEEIEREFDEYHGF